MSGLQDHANEIVVFRAKCKTDAWIARHYGYSRQRVLQVMGPRGDKRPPHALKFVNEARRLWDKGLSMTSIGERLGVSKGVIAGLSYRHGFKSRHVS
jgi:hypothetical protein